MPLFILGGIFFGQFTPSEAAAVAVIYAALVSFFVYRDLTFRELGKILLGSAITMSHFGSDAVVGRNFYAPWVNSY